MSLSIEAVKRFKKVSDRWIPDVGLELISQPSFEEARILEKKGKWDIAAHHFYTLAETSDAEIVRARSGIELAQMLINLSRYRQAEEHLSKVESGLSNLPEEERSYISAK